MAFKVGDRVSATFTDKEGTISMVEGDEAWVLWDEGWASEDRHCTVKVGKLTLIPPEPRFKVGDRVQGYDQIGTILCTHRKQDGTSLAWVEWPNGQCYTEKQDELAPVCCK